MPDTLNSRNVSWDGEKRQMRFGEPVARWLEVGQGDYAVSRSPDLTMTATLGSCVAVILHDVFGCVGGMTHIFQCVDPGPAGRGAVVAEIEKLVNALMREGVRKSVIEARVVGGARTLGRGRDVGGEIARVCLDFLAAEHIPLAGSDLGGQSARRITYVPASGLLTIAYPGDAVKPAVPPRPRCHGDPELF